MCPRDQDDNARSDQHQDSESEVIHKRLRVVQPRKPGFLTTIAFLPAIGYIFGLLFAAIFMETRPGYTADSELPLLIGSAIGFITFPAARVLIWLKIMKRGKDKALKMFGGGAIQPRLGQIEHCFTWEWKGRIELHYFYKIYQEGKVVAEVPDYSIEIGRFITWKYFLED